MYTLLNSSLTDNILFCTYIIALITTIISSLKKYINDKSFKINLKEKYFNYFLFWMIALILIISAIIYINIISSKHYTTIFGLAIIICAGYYVYKAVNAINKKNFNKIQFSNDDKYNIILSQFIYFIFFQKEIYSMLVEHINNINNSFISDCILLTYMTLKTILILFFYITNILIALKNIYNVFIPNTYNKILKIKRYVYGFELNFEINEKDFKLITPKSISNNRILKKLNTKKFINKIDKFNFFNKFYSIFILIKIPFLILIFYAIEIIKSILMLLINPIVISLTFFKKKLNNEIIFFYKHFNLCAYISIFLIYIHILNHNTFNQNSIKAFEFFGLTIIVTIITQHLKDISNNSKNKI